jgi:membrane fusion protein, epimerase transport system
MMLRLVRTAFVDSLQAAANWAAPDDMPAAAPASAPAMSAAVPSPSASHALHLRKLGWRVIAGALLPILVWMAWAPLSMAVVAPAFVKVDLNRRPVQHLEGGIVRAVLVRDGQRVRAGDPVLELGTVSVDADRSRIGLRVHAERAAVTRLEAERTQSTILDFDDDLDTAARLDPRVAQMLRKERSLFESRRSSLASESMLLRRQRERIGSEIGALGAEITQARKALELQRRDLERSRSLLGDGYISATRVSQLEAGVADYASRIEERRSEVERAQQRLLEIDLKLKTAQNNHVQQASDQLKATVARLGDVEQEQRKSEDAAQRQVVTAPADGEVIDLKFTSPGAVVRAGEPIADIVPSGAPLLIEAQIRPEEINHVTTDQPARIKLLASRFRNNTTLTGVVRYVSGDRLIDRTSGMPYYTAMIAANAESLAATEGLKLQAGMPVEVYIEGTAQTALQYLLEPITTTMRRAARPL